MPRKTSFCNAALLRSDIKRYWPLLFLYVAVWVVILPMQILSASRECDGVAEGIMTVLQLRQHNVIIQSIPASVVMSLLFGCFAAMAVWSYLMSGRTVGLMHALPVTRTQAFFSHVLSALGALTAGNVLIFLLTALCSAGFSYVDWAALGTWLLLTELMALFFFALGSLCAMVTGWLLAVPVLYGAMNVIALLLYAVISTMTQMFYFGYSNSDIPEFITWLTPVGRIWDAVANGGAQPVEVQFREPIGTQSYQRVQLPASAFSTCIIYAAVGIALLALVWWLYKKRPSETAGDAMSFRWLRPIARPVEYRSVRRSGAGSVPALYRLYRWRLRLPADLPAGHGRDLLLRRPDAAAKEVPHLQQALVAGDGGHGAGAGGGDGVREAGHHRLSAPRPGRGGRDLRPLQRQLCGFHRR